MSRLIIALLALAVTAMAAGAAHADGGGVLVVDRDRVECPNAPFVSIQEAVVAAQPGDRIKVCPDLYNETVTVDKPLWLDGQTGAIEAQDCFEQSAADPARHAIVMGGLHSFRLLANDVVLEGFVVQGARTGIDTDDAFSGYRVRHNIVQSNLLDGMEFQSSGATESRVDHNCFRQNTRGGLMSELGNLHNARADHNSTSRNVEGIVFGGPGSRAGVSIDHNVSRGDRFGLGIQNSTTSSVAHNEVSEFRFGIVVGGGSIGLEVAHNRLETGLQGIVFAPTLFFDVFPIPNVAADVRRNVVSAMTLDGIVAAPTSVHQSHFENNDTSDNLRDGTVLRAGNVGNVLRGNNAYRNGRIGIYANGATGNLFDGNHMLDNSVFDARDDLRALNTWTDNHCVTDFPPGTICGVG